MRIRDKVKKPSEALRAMVDGLLEQDAREDFEIEMVTFGDVDDGVCFGCAATCAVQKIAGKNLSIENIQGPFARADALGFNDDELELFEEAINSARYGDLRDIFSFFALPRQEADKFSGQFFLTTGNWKSKLPEVRKIIKQLDEEGY